MRWGYICPTMCTASQNLQSYFRNTQVLPSVNRMAGPIKFRCWVHIWVSGTWTEKSLMKPNMLKVHNRLFPKFKLYVSSDGLISSQFNLTSTFETTKQTLLLSKSTYTKLICSYLSTKRKKIPRCLWNINYVQSHVYEWFEKWRQAVRFLFFKLA